jgi:hypothetical protein
MVGRPSQSTARPASTSAPKRATIGANNSGSHSTRSSAARSSGNSRTSTGRASSHNDSA